MTTSDKGVDNQYFDLNKKKVLKKGILYIIRELAVGNPSAIEGQTTNILIS